MTRNAITGAIVIVVVGSILFGFYQLMAALSGHGTANEVVLPILAIGGVILMLAALAAVSLFFAKFQLQDRAQALGLPEGSIRAVIALSLIVLFAILSIYLYGNISTYPVGRLSNLTKAQYDELLVRGLPKDRIVASYQVGVGDDGAPTFVIELRGERNLAGDDFAKQILVLLGTLVTSISSFYFGAKAGASGMAGSTETPTPLVRSVNPSTYASGSGPLPFKIQGDNLSQVKEVKIVSGNSQVLATGVTANDSLVACEIDVPAGATTGPWDVVVTDSSSQASTLADALTVT